MPVRQMSETVVEDLAHLYGIEVRWVDDVPRRRSGPASQGCDPKRRLLYFLKKDTIFNSEIEHYFHELVHVVVQPPWRRWSISDTPEEFILFQFERALARATLEEWAFERVVDWQCNTYTRILQSHLDSDPRYDKRGFWRLGFKMCRVLGLLDQNNRPTYRWPDWSRLSPFKSELFEYYWSFGINSAPRLG